MNKRMREPFHSLIWKASIGYNDSWSQVDPEVLEKFAESIVAECLSEVARISVLNESEEIDWAADRIIENIQKKFGVEE